MSDRVLNSEILFIYEAVNCNPNGDPNADNKPRIDLLTGRNYVTDVRLKRFLRDYILNYFNSKEKNLGERKIFVSTQDGKPVVASEKATSLEQLKQYIDVRLFGAVLPIKEKDKKGKGSKPNTTETSVNEDEGSAQGEKSEHIIGPVQFTLGYSLNKVEIISEASQISSHFVGKVKEEREAQHGTYGRDWRLYYSLIAFYGTISKYRSEISGLKDTDIKCLDNLLWEALMKESLTRSKIGHAPHLYLRVEYNDDTFMGDLRRFIKDDMETDHVTSFDQVKLGFSNLYEALSEVKTHINRIYLRVSDPFEKKYEVKKVLAERYPYYQLPHVDFDIDSI